MVKVKIGLVEYEISVIPPRIAPFNALYADLIQRKVASVEEAEEVGRSLAEISKIVLSATVVPVPPEAHYSQLYNAVAELTNRALSQSFFPADRK